MLIDRFMPEFDVVERHQLTVSASRAACYAALERTDFAGSGLLRLVLGLRALPSALFAGLDGWRAFRERGTRPITLATMESGGFVRLAESPPDEIVLGIEGQFWKPSGGQCTPDAHTFASRGPAAGTARGLWNFTFTAIDASATRVSTETRVLCADAAGRRRFLPYWFVIRPGSGLLRHIMLRRLRETAERSAP